MKWWVPTQKGTEFGKPLFLGTAGAAKVPSMFLTEDPKAAVRFKFKDACNQYLVSLGVQATFRSVEIDLEFDL